MLATIGIAVGISAFWLVAMLPALPNVADTIKSGPHALACIFDAHFSHGVTNAFLISACVATFVCGVAIQAATTRLLFAYGRDKMVPAHSQFFGSIHPPETPMTSALFVAVVMD